LALKDNTRKERQSERLPICLHAHGGMQRAILCHVVSDYVTNWLAQHGEMPTGLHKAHTVRRRPMIYTISLLVLTADLRPLR
jgi:hypothetical protein